MQTEVAAELGIMPTMLRRWQRKLQDSNDMLVSPAAKPPVSAIGRTEEHTSELQSLIRISYAVFCLKNKNTESSKSAIPRKYQVDSNSSTTIARTPTRMSTT